LQLVGLIIVSFRLPRVATKKMKWEMIMSNMESTKSLNVALIGLGMVADTHVQAIAGLKGKVHLKGIFARRQSIAQEYSSTVALFCGYDCEVYPSIEAVANDSDLDFVIIATPPNARIDIVKLFAKAKMPMLMEKPIERTTQAATEIVEICEQSNVPLGLVFQHRARLASLQLQKMIQSGELGTLGLANIEAPLWRSQAYYDEPGRGTYERDGGGVLLSQASHTIDLALSMTGDIAEVQAMSRTTAFHQMESEDFVTAGITFKNGAIGNLLATTANYPGEKECVTLHFDHAVAKLHRAKLDIFWRDGRRDQYGEDEKPTAGDNPMDFKSTWHGGIIADFAAAITHGKAPMVTGREGLKVHRLIDALIASSERKRAVTL
jgi:predicted dehydrogenase